MTWGQLRVRNFIPVIFAILLLSVAGCAGRHPAPRAKTNLALVGVWNWHSQKKGIDLTAVVYPLQGRAYLVQAVPFFTKRPLIGCGLFKAKLRRVDGKRYLFCQWLLPNLTDQSENLAALEKSVASARGSRRSLVRAMIDSAKKTGLARAYFALRIDSISASDIAVTPMLGKKAFSSWDDLSSSPRRLAAFIRSPAGVKLAAGPSRVFKRTTAKAALPVAFYTSP